MINVTDLFPAEAPVDETAYCIVLICDNTEERLWKRSMARELNEWRDTGKCPLNITDNVSVQTVCRRIDELVEKGYLHIEPVYSDDLGRYIDSYVVTENGEALLASIHSTIVNKLYVELFDHSLSDTELILKKGTLEKLATYTRYDLGPEPEQLADSFQNVASVELPDVSIQA